MADVSITAANVVANAGAGVDRSYNAGETVTAGDALHLKASDGKLWKCQNDGSAGEEAFYGIALNGAGANQPVNCQTAGPITIGGTVVAGTFYFLSAALGKICPAADLVTGNKVTCVGYATTSAVLQVNKINTGVAVP